MNTFQQVDASHIAAAHAAYMSVFDWLNAKGVRQWLRALTPETFAQRQRDGQLFALWIDNKLAAVVTLAFEHSTYWPEIIGNDPRWWVKSLAVVRAWRGEGIGQRVMNECEAIAQKSGANEVYLDCDSTGFLPRITPRSAIKPSPKKKSPTLRVLLFSMVLTRKELKNFSL